MAKTRGGDTIALLDDDTANGGWLGMALWGFTAVVSVVLGYASWQFAPTRPDVVTAQVAPDHEDVTGSIASAETAGGTTTAARPVGGGRITPLLMAPSEEQVALRDFVQLRADVRDLQRRIAQMGLSGDGVSRRIDRLEERINTTSAALAPPQKERTATNEAPPAPAETRDGPAAVAATAPPAPATAATQPQGGGEAVRIPQPRPDGDLPVITGSVPPKAVATTTTKADRVGAAATPAPDAAKIATPAPDAAKTTTPAPATVAALDLGGFRSLAALKQAWGDLSGRHAELGSGIEPLARLHETDGGIEARLVVGPYPDQTEAAKGCVRLKTLGVPCAVTGYAGQPLAAMR